MPRSTADSFAARNPSAARSRSFSATARRIVRIIFPDAPGPKSSVAEYTLPPADSILSRATVASLTDRLKRAKFQTAIPRTSPRTTASIARFHPGLVASPPEASSSSTTSKTSRPSRRARASICSRWSCGEMKLSPSRPPTFDTLTRLVWPPEPRPFSWPLRTARRIVPVPISNSPQRLPNTALAIRISA